MYGTVAKLRVKAGSVTDFQQIAQEIGVGRAPGQVAVYAYQLDRDPREFIMVAMFDSKEAYVANAQSPEQHERFMKLMQVLETEPEWNDGEVVYATGF